MWLTIVHTIYRRCHYNLFHRLGYRQAQTRLLHYERVWGSYQRLLYVH